MSDTLFKFENKQLIHIVSEGVLFLGMAFYFSSKNKKLQGHIEELAQRLEEQEDKIQKLETNTQQGLSELSRQNNTLLNGLQELKHRIELQEGRLLAEEKKYYETAKPKKQVEPIKKPVEQLRSKPIEQSKPERTSSFFSSIPVPVEMKTFSQNKIEEIKEEDEEDENDIEDDSELDNQIQEELQDLVDLKKRD